MSAQSELLKIRATCSRCGHDFAAWALDGKGRCGGCRLHVQRRWSQRSAESTPQMTWADVRAMRNKMLASTDWTQLADVPAGTSACFAGLRQRLRDLTDLPDCMAALRELGAIEAEITSMTQPEGE